MLIDKWCIMFNIFKKKSTSEKAVAKNRRFEINLIASVLAYEVARSDGAVSEDEFSEWVVEAQEEFATNENNNLVYDMKGLR